MGYWIGPRRYSVTSVPQIPVAWTSRISSPGARAGSGTGSIRISAVSWYTAAFTSPSVLARGESAAPRLRPRRCPSPGGAPRGRSRPRRAEVARARGRAVGLGMSREIPTDALGSLEHLRSPARPGLQPRRSGHRNADPGDDPATHDHGNGDRVEPVDVLAVAGGEPPSPDLLQLGRCKGLGALSAPGDSVSSGSRARAIPDAAGRPGAPAGSRRCGTRA